MPNSKALTITVVVSDDAVALGPDFVAAFIRAQADRAIDSALNSNEFWGLFQKGDKT